MSVITLHHGQCGSQICEALFSNIFNDISNFKKGSDHYIQSINKWFRITKLGKLEPRSVIIDTENKTAPSNKNAHYQFKNVITKSCGGSGNNWSFGYCEQSKLLVNEVLECVRKELEICDVPPSFLNIFSSSGGTGAGVGSFIIETLKHEFPSNKIVNAVILPYSDGELVTQSYNTLLTLSKIYSISNAIFLFENDRLHYNCINSLNIKNVTFNDINNSIAKQLVSIYQPLKNLETLDILEKLCSDPSFKFLQTRFSPCGKLDSANNWKSLLTSISRQSRFDLQQKSYYQLDFKYKCFSKALICRGVYSPEEKDFKNFIDCSSCKFLNIYYNRRKIFNLENCLSVISNSNNVYVPLNVIMQDAQNLYKYRAYLHHYKKFGIDETHFETSFETVETILKNYKSL